MVDPPGNTCVHAFFYNKYIIQEFFNYLKPLLLPPFHPLSLSPLPLSPSFYFLFISPPPLPLSFPSLPLSFHSPSTAFIQSPTSVIATPGQAVTLYCSYPGNTTVTWDKGSLHLAINPSSYPCNCQLQQNGTTSGLIFSSIGGADFDNYSCNVQIGPGVTCTSTALISKASKLLSTIPACTPVHVY